MSDLTDDQLLRLAQLETLYDCVGDFSGCTCPRTIAKTFRAVTAPRPNLVAVDTNEWERKQNETEILLALCDLMCVSDPTDLRQAFADHLGVRNRLREALERCPEPIGGFGAAWRIQFRQWQETARAALKPQDGKAEIGEDADDANIIADNPAKSLAGAGTQIGRSRRGWLARLARPRPEPKAIVPPPSKSSPDQAENLPS
jgi:hypothetical protein